MIELNLSGLNCPLPILKTKKFLANIESGQSVLVITTDPASINDLQEFCTKTGNILVEQQNNGNLIKTIIKRR